VPVGASRVAAFLCRRRACLLQCSRGSREQTRPRMQRHDACRVGARRPRRSWAPARSPSRPTAGLAMIRCAAPAGRADVFVTREKCDVAQKAAAAVAGAATCCAHCADGVFLQGWRRPLRPRHQPPDGHQVQQGPQNASRCGRRRPLGCLRRRDLCAGLMGPLHCARACVSTVNVLRLGLNLADSLLSIATWQNSATGRIANLLVFVCMQLLMLWRCRRRRTLTPTCLSARWTTASPAVAPSPSA
jgi:hypothetical protein